jgi:rhodanese-related sulfurtransferase
VCSRSSGTSATGSSLSSRNKPERSRAGAASPTVDILLDKARRRLSRLTPEQAAAEQRAGALLVDTRTAEQRAAGGLIPGALVIDRTVLEWRLDPTSATKIPEAVDDQVRVIVICAEGYSSSLAAASLQDLGLTNATDVVGGFNAWVAAGLPTTPAN